MRRELLLAAFTAALLTSSTSLAAEEQAGRLYYKDGTRLEFGDDFDVKLNVQLQPRFTYTDWEDMSDTSSFDLRRARLVLSGNMLDKEFSYIIQNDFASQDGGSELKDAWLQWNSKELANIRFGQFKEPFTKQERISSSRLFFTERSIANEFFTLGREAGTMVHRPFGIGNFYIGVFNGNSDYEGTNQPGYDNKVNGVAAVDFTMGEFGSRGEEGDLREIQDLAATLGFSVNYGQGETLSGAGSLGDLPDYNGFDNVALDGDVALRVAGLEFDGEVMWREFSYDQEILPGKDSEDAVGFHLQGLYVLGKLGFGLRYALVSADEEVYGWDEQTEMAVVFNYFINGHNLKLQNNVTWITTDYGATAGGTTDFIYDLQLAGYF